jgi:hypothetical protein
MAGGWRTVTREQELAALIAQKKYARAIELLRAQFQGGAADSRLRMQLADVLVAAGRKHEAVPIFLGLADEFARDGFVAKAIAVLKKLERIEPGRGDVEKRLAHLVTEKRRSIPSTTSMATLEIGMEEIEIEPHPVSAAGGNAPAAAAPPADLPARPDEAWAAPAETGTAASEQEFEEEFFDELAETLKASGAETAAAGTGAAAAPKQVRSPLFDDFTEEELIAVMQRLDLVSFEPGDIVIAEGEPGDSLFVLTTGAVKAFVRNPSGRQHLVREMGEGSFFGEISILSGKPRTATITCTTRCELLELNRKALDAIAAIHPRVHQVLLEFYRQRHGSGEEQTVRGMAVGGTRTPGSQ